MAPRGQRCALWLAVVILSLAACASPVAPTPTPPAMDVVADTPEGQAGVATDSARIHLYLSDADGVLGEVATYEDSGGHTSVHMVTYSGETGRNTNTFAFGYAPKGAVSVEVGPQSVATALENGVFVAVLSAKDLPLPDLSWKFLDASGKVIEQGTGLEG